MALTTLPTRTDASVGASPKRNRRTVRDRQTCIPAEEYEALADSVVAVCADVGTDTSPASGSLKKRMNDAETTITALDGALGSLTTTVTDASTLRRSGSGSPEGVVTATPGTTYQDTTNGVFYTKRSGNGNTGWVRGWLDYVPAQRASTSSLYLFDGNLNDSGPAGRNLTALVGTIRYVPLRTGTRRFAQVASGAVCFAQASNAWTDAVYPVTIEGVVNTTLCNGLTSFGGVIASLSNAAAPTGTVWALRVMNDYTVSLYYHDATSTLRELVSTNYVPSVGDCVIHGVIPVSGGDTTLTIYINGLASGTTTFAGNIPRAVVNQRASIMGWLDGAAQWGQTHPRPFYACHLMLEALDASTCLARSQAILNV